MYNDRPIRHRRVGRYYFWSFFLYIRADGDQFYIGIASKGWNARYSKNKEIRDAGPIDFIPGIPHIANNLKGTQTLLHDIENAVIRLNGGVGSPTLSNGAWSRYSKKEGGTLQESIERGRNWLDENVTNWRERFDYRNTSDYE